ncbi:ATP-binding cassette domain-containing protein [Gordonia sp. NPDC127522]|uniref:ATP-binding cassette domain-containing protein n=1 Tax=Gordonia sp. NPDC127522 TaxID=3345390 RepID=UPI003628EFD3
MSTALIELRGVTKTYGDSTVLDSVDLALRPGVVHGLIGRNGAGKSTLVGVLTGRHAPDAGQIVLDGEPVTFSSPGQATSHGVVAVPQEIILPMQMTVREAVTLGAEPHRGGLIGRGRERSEVHKIVTGLGLDLDLESPVGSLPVSWQKIVLVAQLLYRKSRIIAFDEPTSAMNPDDAERVAQLVEDLRDHGVAVLYISHRLEEVERLCDEVTVLRDGKKIQTLTGTETESSNLVRIMMRDDEKALQAAPPMADVSEVTVSDIGDHLVAHGTSRGILTEFDLDVAPGELVGVAGLPGSGVEEVFAILSGASRPDSGSVRLGPRVIRSVRSATRMGVSTLPASRRDVLLAEESVPSNMVLSALSEGSWKSFLTTGGVARFCRTIADSLGLAPVYQRQIGQLSGGNQQRALVGGRLLGKPHFLVLEDPTVGVDISARQELHDVLRSLTAEGMGLVVGSSDPRELALLCSRVVVIRRGRVVEELAGARLTEYSLTESMTGATRSSTATAIG